MLARIFQASENFSFPCTRSDKMFLFKNAKNFRGKNYNVEFVMVDVDKSENIAFTTLYQYFFSDWFNERKIRISASIPHMCHTRDLEKLVSTFIAYQTFQFAATTNGLRIEKNCLEMLSQC